MIRLIPLLLLLSGWYFFQRYVPMADREGLPDYVREDRIAAKHEPAMRWTSRSLFPPDTTSVEFLLRDYAALWAHLNHLRSTNQVQAGKNYYTENFYRQICRFRQPFTEGVYRADINHAVSIENWSQDKLICTLVDTVQLRYVEPDASRNSQALVFAVLLKQGDHWRLDAIRFAEEKAIP